MAQHRQRGFQSFSGPCRLALAVLTLMCATASTTAQQQLPPLPQPQPLPQPTTTPAIPSVPACLPSQQASLSPCFSYLMGNSSSPPTECCAQMRAMFQSQAPCLCALMASGPSQLLGSTLGQLLPTTCDLPANACSGGGTSADPATTTPASGTGTAPGAAAAPAATEPNGVDPTTAAVPAGGAGVKSVPGVLASAAAPGSGGLSAAVALFMMSLIVVYVQ